MPLTTVSHFGETPHVLLHAHWTDMVCETMDRHPVNRWPSLGEIRNPARWEEFRHRYKAELAGKKELLDNLRERARKGRLTLVYSAHDEAHNQAVVLQEMLLH